MELTLFLVGALVVMGAIVPGGATEGVGWRGRRHSVLEFRVWRPEGLPESWMSRSRIWNAYGAASRDF